MSSLLFSAKQAVVYLASTPAATDDPNRTPDPEQVTPGTIGFLVTLAVVIATIIIINLAVRAIRRVRAADNAVHVHPIPIQREQPAGHSDAAAQATSGTQPQVASRAETATQPGNNTPPAEGEEPTNRQ